MQRISMRVNLHIEYNRNFIEFFPRSHCLILSARISLKKQQILKNCSYDNE